MTFFSSKSLLYFLLLLLCFLFVYPYIFDPKLFLAGDNANYYILANGIASGDGFINFNSPNPAPANHFSPGYPFLMAILIKIGASSLFAMKVFNGIMLLFSSFLLFHISLRLTKNTTLSILIGLLLLFNTNILQYSTVLMSETSYMTFLLLSVLLFLINKDRGFNYKSIHFYLMLVSIVITIYIRTQGVAIFGALLLIVLFNKKYIAGLIAFSFCFIAILPWQIRSHNLGGSSYMKQIKRVEPYNPNSKQMEFGNWIERVKVNTIRYVSKEIPSSIFSGIKPIYKDVKTGKTAPSPIKNWILGFLILLFSILGIWSVKKYRWFFFLLFGASIIINLLWPQVWFGIRFFLPMVPLTILFSITGVLYFIGLFIKSKTPPLESKKLAYSLVVFALFQIPNIKALHAESKADHAGTWYPFFQVAEWSEDNLPENAVVSCRKPALFYTISKKKTTGFSYTVEREKFFEHFDKNGVTHVLIEQLGFSQTSKFLIPMVLAHPHKFKQTYAINSKPVKNKKGELISSPYAVWIFEYDPKFGYQGKYNGKLKSGKGVFNYRDGGTVEATWVRDTIQGYAEQKLADGRRFLGDWKDGKKHGINIIHSDTTMIESIWIEGVIQAEGYLLDKKKNRIKKIKLK